MLLLDDLDAVQHLLAGASGRLEDVCVGFCPETESLGVPGSPNLCELHDLPDAERNPCNDQLSADQIREHVRRHASVAHQFQRDTPLLIFTKYKMYGLASIGEGLLVQQALFKAMARKIRSTLAALRDAQIDPFADRGDLERIRCAFVDLTGAEEVGTLAFTRNASVAAALIGALRSLTFRDLFDADRRIERLLQKSNAHRWIMELACHESLDPARAIQRYEGNHVFQWSHSTFGVSPEAFWTGEDANCTGYVEAATQMQLFPGHRCEVEDLDTSVLPDGGEEAAQKRAAERGYYRLMVGASDLIVFHGLGAPKDARTAEADTPLADRELALSTAGRLPLLRIRSFLRGLRQYYHVFGRERSNDHGPDVNELVSTLVIPVPHLSQASGSEGPVFGAVRAEKHTAPLHTVLPMLSRQLCGLDLWSDGGAFPGAESRKMSIQSLTDGLRDSGVPVSLRRTTEYLYRFFATTIANPSMFDVVLDIYDAFAALHRVVTKHLPETMPVEDRPVSMLLDEERTRQLARFVQALQDALIHRTAKTYPEVSFWDMASEFRGGLNQIVLAADAPMKCALGIARLFTGGKEPEELHYGRLGVLAAISPVPGVECYSLRLGVEPKTQLAFFDVDVPHLVHIASYYDFIHEGCHLVFDALADRAEPDNELFHIEDPFVREWVSEIFAMLLSQLLVFGSDVDAALFNGVATFSRSLQGVGSVDYDTVVRFTEVLIRYFIVYDAIRRGVNEDTELAATVAPEWAGTADREAATDRFLEMVRRVGPLFWGFERFYGRAGEGPAWRYAGRQFDNVYARVVKYMPSIWQSAAQVYNTYCKEEIPAIQRSNLPSRESLFDEIDRCLEEGRPIIRSLLETPGTGNGGRRNSAMPAQSPNDGFLSRPFVIFTLLRRYIGTIKRAFTEEGEPKRIHLARDEKREPVYNASEGGREGSRPWYEFQCERGRIAMYSPLPSERRRRLRKHIVILKSLWDVSSCLRARRLCQMLCDSGLR